MTKVMKICAVGDPHGALEKIKKIPLKDVDLILCTGDLGAATKARARFFENVKRQNEGKAPLESDAKFSKARYIEAYQSSVRVLRHLSRFAPVWAIYGNVESSNKDVYDLSEEVGEDLPILRHTIEEMDGRVFNNRIANFEGVRIGGLEFFLETCWVQEFKPKPYKKYMASARKRTEKARKVLNWFDQVDILVCHVPPYGVLDKVGRTAPKHWHGKHAGSKVTLEYIKRKQPKYVFCGHIHEGEGVRKIGKSTVYNLGVCGHVIVDL